MAVTRKADEVNTLADTEPGDLVRVKYGADGVVVVTGIGKGWRWVRDWDFAAERETGDIRPLWDRVPVLELLQRGRARWAKDPRGTEVDPLRGVG